MQIKVSVNMQDKETQIQLCQGCELPVYRVAIQPKQSAYCPRCGSLLYQGTHPSLSGNLALAITCLLLLILAHWFNFLTIRLFGIMISASLPAGIWAIASEGYPALALLVFFCSSLAPLLILMTIMLAHFALHYRWFNIFRYSLLAMQKLKPWSMIDVFLVSVAVSCFKLIDYADIFIGPALYSLLLLQILTILLISRISIQRYWEAWQPESHYPKLSQKRMHCHYCHLSQDVNEYCIRCNQKLHYRKPLSIQRTWAYTCLAAIAIIPANVIPISIFISHGQRLEDTIFSGVVTLINNGMYAIAAIIFIASIVVPVVKILALIYLLLTIQYHCTRYHRQRMTIYYIIKWIGKWSVMDLFVISIMLSLIDHGQLLNFTPGYGAVAFGCVVILTMLATESLDSRLIWDSIAVNTNHSESSDE
ncbi:MULTISPECIES: paraquat-inducible protein A [unclassified Vibrio]|uniref:paraquat-inducible protein A n=1 Tax=unclassified Vibrio TaxID=2614977 RepID=UPI001372CC59|nr:MULTISPECIES: paraquat-inducible protein A [unclassified Vibrio]NAW68778.1 PqiA/YebS family transporter subunit [Vibrio sp. V28_P6S34P95]NAX03685.1 PqiA/YebS family transporter subunit [Vibrio sp. V30_P3S12P165]NAX33660.1 PqiA/YebS family transporter subunit [Vibrio sp. V29_P1S30P107]NAX36425.1 PqiA/YebS family transporter subunit [Vibrio sp. V27_P1S3P104]NAX40299.1 PqiA/YebS family transporter subunit [Vibrio sp. V26_P1S5P106]